MAAGTLFSDLERCISATCMESDIDDVPHYSTTEWQLERLRRCLNELLKTSEGEGEAEPIGGISLTADCLRRLITKVNDMDTEESDADDSKFDVPTSERTSTIHALLYELYARLNTGTTVAGKRYSDFGAAWNVAANSEAPCHIGTHGDYTCSNQLSAINANITLSAPSNEPVSISAASSTPLMNLTNATIVIDKGVTLNATNVGDNYGAGLILNNNCSVTFNGGYLTNAHCNYGGGGIRCQGGASTITINDGGLINCAAGSEGGGVYLANSSTLTMNGGEITNCKANSANGAAVVMKDNSCTFTMSGGTISDCVGQNCGGVFINGGNFTLSGGTISNCVGQNQNHGGAVKVCSGQNFIMTGGLITGCSAPYGGGIYVEVGNATMSGGAVTNCNATTGGGGVYATNNGNSHFTLSGGDISGCTAPNGADIYIQTSANFEWTGGTVEGLAPNGDPSDTANYIYNPSYTGSTLQ